MKFQLPNEIVQKLEQMKSVLNNYDKAENVHELGKAISGVKSMAQDVESELSKL